MDVVRTWLTSHPVATGLGVLSTILLSIFLATVVRWLVVAVVICAVLSVLLITISSAWFR